MSSLVQALPLTLNSCIKYWYAWFKTKQFQQQLVILLAKSGLTQLYAVSAGFSFGKPPNLMHVYKRVVKFVSYSSSKLAEKAIGKMVKHKKSGKKFLFCSKPALCKFHDFSSSNLKKNFVNLMKL